MELVVRLSPDVSSGLERLAASAGVTPAQAAVRAIQRDIERLNRDEEIMELSERAREQFRETLDRLARE